MKSEKNILILLGALLITGPVMFSTGMALSMHDEPSLYRNSNDIDSLTRPCEDRSSYELEPFTIKVYPSGGFAILRQGEEILSTTGGTFLEARDFVESVILTFGIFHFNKLLETSVSMDWFIGVEWTGERLTLTYSSRKRPWTRAMLTLELHSEYILRCGIELSNFLCNRGMVMRFACTGDSHFLGFGEQYNKTDQRGQVFETWVSEQGFGRAEKPVFPWQGDLNCSYFTMPYFLDPRGFGFLLDSSAFSRFDLGGSVEDEWSFEVWESEKTSFLLFGGPEPLDVISQLTEITGRSQMPPDWAFSTWLAVQGGRAEVEEVADLVEEEALPVSVIWSQDWVGTRCELPFMYELKYHWIADEDRYPDLPGMIADLHDRGLRFLGYFNPFVVPRYEHFLEGAANGYLITNCIGLPYIVLFADFFTSMVDLTNPEAVEWVQGYLADAMEMGMDGWMCDFGEWLPYDARLYDGTPASHYHNFYPTEWHRINREVLDRYRPDGDYVIFSRSGFTGESGVAQIVWAGDQGADWTTTDGIPTIVPAGLNLGISGVPFFTHDIAGFSGGPSTKELFFRWTELGAFTPVMRTHDGLAKALNWNFRKDGETLAHFRKYARIHELLKDYIISYGEEYLETGHPIIRHHVLLYPGDPRSVAIDDQYFLGNDLLIAPVLEEGAVTREVYLPEGIWYYIWDNTEYGGPCDIVVDAPPGIIPVFSRHPIDWWEKPHEEIK